MRGYLDQNPYGRPAGYTFLSNVYSDSFNRGPTSDNGDTAWNINPGGGPVIWTGLADITAWGHGFINASNQLQIQNTIFAAAYGGARLTPTLKAPYYVQCTFRGWLAGTNGRTGLFFNNDNTVAGGFNWVGISIIAGGFNNWGFMAGGGGNNAGAPGIVNAGDIIRIEVRNSGVNGISLLRNGIVVAQTQIALKADSYAGIWQANTSGGSTATFAWDDFEFGEL